MTKNREWRNDKWEMPESSEKPKSGMEDDPDGPPCTHPEHVPPILYPYIPPGQRYLHVCPGCKKETIIRYGGVMW